MNLLIESPINVVIEELTIADIKWQNHTLVGFRDGKTILLTEDLDIFQLFKEHYKDQFKVLSKIDLLQMVPNSQLASFSPFIGNISLIQTVSL